ncbi:tetratricopeptide repeat protein [Rudanella paleaurantiibacter]|uniref:Tetratricopeptide repeat protein n=1 Tax=Rudanella paleaurantiibacter TaxID=2614655 RepID=A0A7J5TY22_9BACT|nr:tetratricopeptide repeat protein [Rudanella paleaurantiibacter]KAB7730032.1 tetratricopeptide repeat protein [Rudanella paleaurantiibacter]
MKGSWSVWLSACLVSICPLFGGAERGLFPSTRPARPDSIKSSSPVRSAASVPTRKDPVPGQNNTAILFSKAGKQTQALSLLTKAGQTRPSDTLTYNRALILLKLKRLDEAATALQKLNTFAHAQLNLGGLQCRQGDWARGLKTLQAAPATQDWADEKAVNIALAHYQLGQYKDAERTLSGATGSAAQLLRADLALVQGFYADALKGYKALENDETFGAVIPVRMGNALLGMRKFADAAALFEQYLAGTDRTAHGAARLGLANARYGQREFGPAAAEYRAAVQLLPQSTAARTGLANALASNRDYRSARAQYETVLRQDPTSLNARMGLGVVAFRQGNVPESVGHLRQVAARLDPTNPDHADAYLHQGLASLSISRFDTARRALEIVSRLRPGDPSAFSGLSEVYRRQDLYGQALEMLQQAINKTAEHHWPGAQPPPELSAKTRARMQANRGSLLLKLNLMDQAYPVFQDALKDDPSNLNALNGVAVSLLEMDQLDKAHTLYDSLINRGHRRAFLLNNRGIVRSYMALQLDKKKQTEEARKYYTLARQDYEKAQQMDTSRRFYQNNLGNVLKNLNLYDEAVKSYQAYMSRSAINNMGVLYAANRKPDFSRYYLNLAIELDSNNLIYQYNRVKLYRTFYPDSLNRKPNLLAAERRLPTQSISAKYSRDGYINIYLYDYDFDVYDYPPDHRFPLALEPPRPPDLLPIDDFVAMPEPADPTPITAKAAPSAVNTTPATATETAPPPVATRPAVTNTPAKRSRMPKPARPRRSTRWGSTRCPTF